MFCACNPRRESEPDPFHRINFLGKPLEHSPDLAKGQEMGGVKKLLNYGVRLDVPAEAFADSRTHEVDNNWLQDASEENQVAAMAQWFLTRFCDPADETPYMSSEGGYIWVHGGPYDATEEIEGRFQGVASEEAVEKAIDFVQREGIYDWAPTSLTYLDEADDVYIDSRNEPTQRLEERIRYLLDVLDLKGGDETKGTARNLVYAGVISALEAFLHETMLYWVSNKGEVVASIVTDHPKFRDQKINLGEIFQVHAALEKQVKAHLRKVVWHREDDVVPLFKHGLGIELGFHRFKDEITIRHDIVHRFSMDSNGDPIQVEEEDVQNLAKKVVQFANEVDEKIADRFDLTPF